MCPSPLYPSTLCAPPPVCPHTLVSHSPSMPMHKLCPCATECFCARVPFEAGSHPSTCWTRRSGRSRRPQRGAPRTRRPSARTSLVQPGHWMTCWPPVGATHLYELHRSCDRVRDRRVPTSRTLRDFLSALESSLLAIFCCGHAGRMTGSFFFFSGRPRAREKSGEMENAAVNTFD